MNIAYPRKGFEDDLAAIEGFKGLLRDGFQNPEGIKGTVRLTIPEHPEAGFIVRYGEMLEVEASNLHNQVDTEVTMPIRTIHRIFEEFEYLDWRDPEIIGTITFSGNLGFANHLAKSCLRPSNWTIERFEQVGRLHQKNGYKNLSEIEYLHQPGQMQILEAMNDSRPVVITGLEPTPPCKDWSLERLAERYPHAVTRVRSAMHSQTMSEFVDELRDFISNPYDEMIEGFVKPYTEGAQLPQEMWDDFGPLFFNREDFVPPQLWLGAVPTHIPTSSLHRDPQTGFLLQVIGRKRLDLYSADQEELLYPHKAYNNYQPCWFKPEQADYKTYPKAKQASCLSVTLNPGELLIQPAGWFHQVYALDSPNMSVSYFWRY